MTKYRLLAATILVSAATATRVLAQPVIDEPGASVSVLPTPANWIATMPPLLMVPALKTEEPPAPA